MLKSLSITHHHPLKPHPLTSRSNSNNHQSLLKALHMIFKTRWMILMIFRKLR